MDAAATEEGPFDQRSGRCGPGGGGVGHDGRQRCRMVKGGADGRHRGPVSAVTQQSIRKGARLYTNNTYPVRCSSKDEEEKDIPSFSSSSFDAVTTTTVTDTAPAVNAKAQAKDSFVEEAAWDSGGRLALQRSHHGGRRRWFLLLVINITQQISITAIDNLL